ncbi:MAG TPA: hypothetical protein PLT35_13560, partial [Vicinamibacterales bacterium]|nr:hypothetical protein [Vicinamibacterales bacterium]
LLSYAVSTEPEAHCASSLAADRAVRSLQPLERWVLGVCLALIGDPELVVCDDVDGLRGEVDRRAAWAVVGRLTQLAAAPGRSRRGTGEHPLAVVASCRDPHLAREALGGIPVVDVPMQRPAGRVGVAGDDLAGPRPESLLPPDADPLADPMTDLFTSKVR